MKSTRDYSTKQELYVASYLDATPTKNSGAGVWEKGDLIKDDMVIECKTKVKPSTQFTIKKEWIDKLRSECISMGKTEWSIVFDFGNIGDEYAVIPLDLFKDLLEWREHADE